MFICAKSFSTVTPRIFKSHWFLLAKVKTDSYGIGSCLSWFAIFYLVGLVCRAVTHGFAGSVFSRETRSLLSTIEIALCAKFR
jgi:hypothetical protein